MSRTAKQEYAASLTINQLGDSASFLALINVIAQSYDSLDDMLHYIATFNLEQAQGVWLDLIGLIVGQSRVVPTVLQAEYFGYRGQPTGVAYGVARYRKRGDATTATSVLGDTEYRNAIRGRIARNWGALDEVGMVETVQTILQISDVTLDRPAPGTIVVQINEPITASAQAMIEQLDLIPRAAGVGLQIDIAYGY